MKTNNIRPMLARSYSCYDPEGWWMSEKLDGVRAIWTGCEFISRNGKTFPAPQELIDSMPSGVDVTVTPEWGMIETRPGFFRIQADDAATDKARVALVVNVRYWRWIVVLAKEHGNTTTDGTLVIDAALIVG